MPGTGLSGEVCHELLLLQVCQLCDHLAQRLGVSAPVPGGQPELEVRAGLWRLLASQDRPEQLELPGLSCLLTGLCLTLPCRPAVLLLQGPAAENKAGQGVPGSEHELQPGEVLGVIRDPLPATVVGGADHLQDGEVAVAAAPALHNQFLVN